ncbi:hypothetical protein HY484_03315 [Candidatus Woesearchaeota archaeon]|nr:hypothetical protein [Candidatus Woesearchaeota archaeon]
MTVLVACLGTGKGTWLHVAKLIKDSEWEHIYLIGNTFGKENFKIEKPNTTYILVNEMQHIPEMTETIKKELDGKIFGDAAVNLVSGDGKEHMATIAALLKVGAGIRLVAVTAEGVKEI